MYSILFVIVKWIDMFENIYLWIHIMIYIHNYIDMLSEARRGKRPPPPDKDEEIVLNKLSEKRLMYMNGCERINSERN